MIIPIPKDEEVEIEPVVTTRRQEWYDWFFSVTPWKCACRLTNFGRNESCARCKTPREKSNG